VNDPDQADLLPADTPSIWSMLEPAARALAWALFAAAIVVAVTAAMAWMILT
jgi:hypothetical protein